MSRATNITVTAMTVKQSQSTNGGSCLARPTKLEPVQSVNSVADPDHNQGNPDPVSDNQEANRINSMRLYQVPAIKTAKLSSNHGHDLVTWTPAPKGTGSELTERQFDCDESMKPLWLKELINRKRKKSTQQCDKLRPVNGKLNGMISLNCDNQINCGHQIVLTTIKKIKSQTTVWPPMETNGHAESGHCTVNHNNNTIKAGSVHDQSLVTKDAKLLDCSSDSRDLIRQNMMLDEKIHNHTQLAAKQDGGRLLIIESDHQFRTGFVNGTTNHKSHSVSSGSSSCHEEDDDDEEVRNRTEEDDELEYGPGFVDKLRSKFLKYSLKTDLISRTNDGFKRCSSLENILDSTENQKNKVKFTHKSRYQKNRTKTFSTLVNQFKSKPTDPAAKAAASVTPPVNLVQTTELKSPTKPILAPKPKLVVVPTRRTSVSDFTSPVSAPVIHSLVNPFKSKSTDLTVQSPTTPPASAVPVSELKSPVKPSLIQKPKPVVAATAKPAILSCSLLSKTNSVQNEVKSTVKPASAPDTKSTPTCTELPTMPNSSSAPVDPVKSENKPPITRAPAPECKPVAAPTGRQSTSAAPVINSLVNHFNSKSTDSAVKASMPTPQATPVHTESKPSVKPVPEPRMVCAQSERQVDLVQAAIESIVISSSVEEQSASMATDDSVQTEPASAPEPQSRNLPISESPTVGTSPSANPVHTELKESSKATTAMEPKATAAPALTGRLVTSTGSPASSLAPANGPRPVTTGIMSDSSQTSVKPETPTVVKTESKAASNESANSSSLQPRKTAPTPSGKPSPAVSPSMASAVSLKPAADKSSSSNETPSFLKSTLDSAATDSKLPLLGESAMNQESRKPASASAGSSASTTLAPILPGKLQTNDTVKSSAMSTSETESKTSPSTKVSPLRPPRKTNQASASVAPVPSLWSLTNGKSSSAQSNGSCMVFDFRGREDVKPVVAIHGSLVRPAETEDDNYTGSTDLPEPSGIAFEGENEVIDGGLLMKHRNKKLKLAFDDSANSTFEYPSESSLLEDVDMTEVEEPNHDSNEKKESSSSSASSSPSPSLSSNLALRGANSTGGLASYKPIVLSAMQKSSGFQFGVSQRPSCPSPTSPLMSSGPGTAGQSQSANCANGQVYASHVTPMANSGPESLMSCGMDMIKPATSAETTSWSTSSSTSDLLF
ncbi:hypothetical protein HDE_01511 [Halotydeus destructor]|nr:hypothetical protein HDE_01511 [Halotydeus destructor]